MANALYITIQQNGRKITNRRFFMIYTEKKSYNEEFLKSSIPGKITSMMKRNSINDNGYLHIIQYGYEELLDVLSLKELDQLWHLIDDELYEHYDAQMREEFIDWYETSQPTAGPDAWRKLRDYERAKKCVNKHYDTLQNIISILENAIKRKYKDACLH
jgi:hypothetical protein